MIFDAGNRVQRVSIGLVRSFSTARADWRGILHDGKGKRQVHLGMASIGSRNTGYRAHHHEREHDHGYPNAVDSDTVIT